MDFGKLYTDPDGRISRRTWWIGALIIAAISIVINLILAFSGIIPGAPQIMAAAADPTRVAGIVNASIQASGWSSLVLLVIFGWPTYCLSVKRRHDKNNNGYDVIGYMALSAIAFICQALGVSAGVGEVMGVQTAVPSAIGMVLGVIVAIYGIYLLVVLGFLRGTTGTNQYGLDPLATP